jgi:hypothetical protein
MTTYTGTPGNDNYTAFPALDEDNFNLLGGDDTLVVLRTPTSGGAFIDAGDGNDFIQVAGDTSFTSHQGFTYFDGTGDYTIVTGRGNDTVSPFAHQVTVTDFDPASDRINLGLSNQLFPGREAYQIVADGSDTLIVHLAGGGQIRLLNVAPSSLNGTNIVGETPITAVLTGTSGANVLSGTSLPEKLIGGGGNDSLTGGGGNDLFLFASRTDGVDQIHDFRSLDDWIGIDSTAFGGAPGDPVDFSPFTGPYSPSQTLFFKGALNAQQFPNPTIVYDPASYTITWVQSATPNGSGGVTYDTSVLAQLDPASTLSYASSSNLGVRTTNWVIAGTGSFADVPGDTIVWRDPGTGHVELSSGTQTTTYNLGTSKGPAWTLAGIADVDGDGTSDILWRNVTTSQVDEWHMKTNNWAGSIDLGAGKGSAWQMAGTGDFNGDGVDDVLWRNTDTGQIDQWQMKNGNWAASIDLGTKSLSWVVAGVGDFNGDGTDDVLWRNLSTGQVDEWQMRNGNWARSIDLGANKGANWEVVGVADLNENRTADILWRDLNTGQTDAWIMKDGNWAGSVAIGPRDTSFQSDGIMSGQAAVVWHNPATGETGTWNLVSTAPSHSWDYLIV